MDLRTPSRRLTRPQMALAMPVAVASLLGTLHAHRLCEAASCEGAHGGIVGERR